MTILLRLFCMIVAALGLFLTLIESRVRFDRAFLYGGAMLLVLAAIAGIDLWPLSEPDSLAMSTRLVWVQLQLALVLPAGYLVVRFHELLVRFRFGRAHWAYAGWSVVYLALLFSGVVLREQGERVELTVVGSALVALTAAVLLSAAVRLFTADGRLRSRSGRRLFALHSVALTAVVLSAAVDEVMGKGVNGGSRGFFVLGVLALSLVVTYSFVRRFMHIVADRRHAHERLQQAYEELDHALPLRRLGQATAMVNREIDSHVFAIEEKLDALAGMEDLPDDARDLVANTRGEVERLRTLSRDVLELARTRVLRDKQPYSIADAVDETLRGPLSPFRERIEVTGAREDVQVLGEPDKLGLALANMARNAFEAGATRVRIDTRADSATATIAIIDNGPGCEPGQLPKLFEAFYTTKPETGCGLGLSIAKSAVDAHGGEITVERDENGPEALGGMRFTIAIPLHAASANG